MYGNKYKYPKLNPLFNIAGAGLGAGVNYLRNRINRNSLKKAIPGALKNAIKNFSRKSLKKRPASMPSLVSRVHPAGTGSSFSKFSYSQKGNVPSKIIKQIASPQHYIITNSIYLLSATGVQTEQVCNCAFSQADLATFVSNLSSFNNTASASSTYPNASQLLLESCTAKYSMTNQTLANIYVDIYDIVPREDNSFTTPLAAWITGASDESGTAYNTHALEEKPFISKAFTTFFKVKKIHKLELAQGKSHVHTAVYRPNYLLNDERTLKNLQIRDLNGWCMFVVRGSACNDSVTKTIINITQAKLDVVQTLDYVYKAVIMNTPRYQYQNNLTAIAVSEDIIDVGAGTVTVDVVA